MSTHNRSAPDEAYQELQDRITKLIALMDQIPGGAAVMSVYLPRRHTYDGLAGGLALHMLDAYTDASQRFVDVLRHKESMRQVRAIMLARLEKAFQEEPEEPLS